LKRLWPDVGPTAKVFVQPVTGKVTAQLRRRWGLNHVLAEDGEKTRADHRHHAIDALVVACADGGYTQKLSRYFEAESEYQRGRGAKPDEAIVPKPWKDIREDAKLAIDEVVVSHRVRKKISGPLHKETVYGDTEKDVVVGGVNYRVIVNRVPVSALSIADIKAESLESARYVIGDHAVRAALLHQLLKYDGDLKKAMAAPLSLTEGGSIIQKVRIISKRQVSGLSRAHNGFVDPEAKHHVAIYRSAEGQMEYEIVSLFEALRRSAARREVVFRRDGKGRVLEMSFSKGDMLTLSDSRAKFWVVREIKSNGQLTIAPHTEARPTKQALVFKPTIAGLLKLKPKKIQVDPIGRVRAAGD
jgi:CRISPR-associated endonuclease Csn1